MSEKFNPKTDLEHDADAFSRNVLRVLRHVIEQIKADGRKSWKYDDIIHLLDNLIHDISAAPTPSSQSDVDIALPQNDNNSDDRAGCIAAGKAAFIAKQARQTNPYAESTEQRRWWDIGWHDAERAKKVAKGGTVTTQSGRQLEIKRALSGYRIQRKENSIVSEWDDILHQYAAVGNGTIFEDYDEALAMMEKLRIGASGIISLIPTDDKIGKKLI
jgi:hypothetical protein